MIQAHTASELDRKKKGGGMARECHEISGQEKMNRRRSRDRCDDTKAHSSVHRV